MIPRLRVILLISLLLSTAAHGHSDARADAWSVDAAVHWGNGHLSVQVTAPIPTSGRNLAAAEHAVRLQLDSELSLIINGTMLELRVDSRQTVSDRMLDDPQIAAQLLQTASRAEMVRVHRSRDMRNVVVEYRLPLFPALAEALVTHQNPTPLPRSVSWVPTRRHTGIVIYAQGQLPVHGTQSSALANPAMLPRIFDRELRPVLAFDMISGDLVRQRGLVRYAADLDDPIIASVAGADPLQITASGLFGQQYTDLLIPVSAADRILSSDENRELLRSGRVVIVISSQNIQETLSTGRLAD